MRRSFAGTSRFSFMMGTPAYFASCVLLVVLAAYDLWSTHRLHRATIWGSAFLIFMEQISRFIGPSAPWHAFVHWMQSWGVGYRCMAKLSQAWKCREKQQQRHASNVKRLLGRVGRPCQ